MIKQKGFSIVTLALLLALTFVSAQPALAGTLTTPRVYMNRQAASLTTAQEFEIFFTTANAASGGAGANEVRLIFPDGNDTQWCRTAGTLTVTGVANPTGATESATILPGSLAGTCAQGSGSGSAESNADRLLITGVNNLSAATKYGLKVVQNSSALGTATAAGNSIKVTLKTRDNSTEIDSSTLALSLISDDQIAVTAVVDVTLSVSLDTNSINLGTLSTTQVNQGGVVSTVSTSAASGYISLVKYNNTLTSGSDTIPDTSGGTIVAGTSEYGASSSDSGNTIGIWSPTACTTTGSTSNATLLSTTFKDFAANTAAVTNETTTLCFLASTTGTQPPGTYTSTATLVTTARF